MNKIKLEGGPLFYFVKKYDETIFQITKDTAGHWNLFKVSETEGIKLHDRYESFVNMMVEMQKLTKSTF